MRYHRTFELRGVPSGGGMFALKNILCIMRGVSELWKGHELVN
jgi:hypothetical protein